MDNKILTGAQQTILPKTMNLAESIEYQKDSIVSKTLLNKASGTVTLFAFDAGQGLSEHSAPFDAMIYLLDGEAEVTISGSPFLLKNGESIIMPAHEPHSLKAVQKFKMMLLMIKSD